VSTTDKEIVKVLKGYMRYLLYRLTAVSKKHTDLR